MTKTTNHSAEFFAELEGDYAPFAGKPKRESHRPWHLHSKEERDCYWRANLAANLAAAGMAAAIEEMTCFDYCGPRRRCQRCGAMTTMREAVS